MTKAQWSAIEALVRDFFDQGLAPDRSDLMDRAFAHNADDDVIDALDTLGPRPIPSLEALKEQLEKNSALA